MNLYITKAEREKLKKGFLNMRKQHVISVSEIIATIGYTKDTLDSYACFLVNEEIKNQIRNVSRANRAHSIIYSNPDLSTETIRFLVFFVNENTEIKDVIFLTEDGKDEDVYELFNGVAIFPSVKKVHIMDCPMIESTLFRWINDLPTVD